MLKQNYIKALFDFPPLRRESASGLHSLVKKFNTNIKMLNQLGEKTQYWDLLLVFFISSRLDPVTRRDWESYSSEHETSSYNDLMAFIQRRIGTLRQLAMDEEPRFPLAAEAAKHDFYIDDLLSGSRTVEEAK